MKWAKKGLVFCPNGSSEWANNSCLQPTPLILNDKIRVFAGFRDEEGVSRIGYVDLSASNPSKVLEVSANPVLDIGSPGAFDENGVVPCAIVKRGEKLFLYYAGYQLGTKVRFYVFGGLAISENYGETFTRFSRVPIIDRTDQDIYFRVIHSIFYENGRWKAYYGGGGGFRAGQNKSLPIYTIKYMESENGIDFPKKGVTVVDIKNDEHRVGRPYVIRNDNMYKMFYGIGTENIPYRLSYAESSDGVNWKIKEDEIGIDLSLEGWDSEMMAYPAVIHYKNATYLFYNGNNYGRDGFGYAELVK